MSSVARFENIKQIVKMVEPQFNELAAIHNAVNYKQEASFALQLLTENSYLASVALGDQDSLKRAIINVAAIGLSLNPVQKLAYLVPRDKRVCLDISYRGYVQLAVDMGAIKWGLAEIVRAKDVYKYVGMGREPIHEFEPFGDRGEIVGAYCVAKTHGEEFILVQMPIDEIFSIRDRSSSWRAYKRDSSKTSPWNTDESEMVKKTVIKRAAKSWPMVDTRVRERLEKAIDVNNEADPIDFTIPVEPPKTDRDMTLERLRTALKYLERTEEKYVEHLIRVMRRDLKKLEELTDLELIQASTMIEQLVSEKKAKEVANENAS